MLTATGSLRSRPNRPGGPATQIANLEVRHRRRARCEDRLRAAKDTGLRNLPLHGFDQNRIWCALVQLACNCSLEPRCSVTPPTRCGAWNRNDCGCDCSLPPPRWPPARQIVAHLAADRPWTDPRSHRPCRDHRAPATRLTRPRTPAPRPRPPTGPWTRRHRPNAVRLSCPSGTITPDPSHRAARNHHHQDHERLERTRLEPLSDTLTDQIPHPSITALPQPSHSDSGRARYPRRPRPASGCRGRGGHAA